MPEELPAITIKQDLHWDGRDSVELHERLIFRQKNFNENHIDPFRILLPEFIQHAFHTATSRTTFRSEFQKSNFESVAALAIVPYRIDMG